MDGGHFSNRCGCSHRVRVRCCPSSAGRRVASPIVARAPPSGPPPRCALSPRSRSTWRVRPHSLPSAGAGTLNYNHRALNYNHRGAPGACGLTLCQVRGRALLIIITELLIIITEEHLARAASLSAKCGGGRFHLKALLIEYGSRSARLAASGRDDGGHFSTQAARPACARARGARRAP